MRIPKIKIEGKNPKLIYLVRDMRGYYLNLPVVVGSSCHIWNTIKNIWNTSKEPPKVIEVQTRHIRRDKATGKYIAYTTTKYV